MLKVDVIQNAYSQATISGLTRQPTSEDLNLALDRLESMAAEYASRQICVGYNFEDEPDPNSESGIPLKYKQAFSTNLAMRIMADFGKEPGAPLVAQARQSLSSMSATTLPMRETQYPSRQPRGSGNTTRWARWARFYPQADLIPQTCATNYMQVGEVDDFTASWSTYLDDEGGETIASYTKTVSPGITVSNDTLATPDITYRVTATIAGTQYVEFEVTTSTGRVDVRQVAFEINASIQSVSQ